MTLTQTHIERDVKNIKKKENNITIYIQISPRKRTVTPTVPTSMTTRILTPMTKLHLEEEQRLQMNSYWKKKRDINNIKKKKMHSDNSYTNSNNEITPGDELILEKR
ncbi:18361_t:CDS:1, partial [Dentiscutata erythropus]